MTLQVASLIRRSNRKQQGTENNRSWLSTCSQVIRPWHLKVQHGKPRHTFKKLDVSVSLRCEQPTYLSTIYNLILCTGHNLICNIIFGKERRRYTFLGNIPIHDTLPGESIFIKDQKQRKISDSHSDTVFEPFVLGRMLSPGNDSWLRRKHFSVWSVYKSLHLRSSAKPQNFHWEAHGTNLSWCNLL